MLHVNIKTTRAGASAQYQAARNQGGIPALADAPGLYPGTGVGVIEGADAGKRGIGGDTVAMRRKAGT